MTIEQRQILEDYLVTNQFEIYEFSKVRKDTSFYTFMDRFCDIRSMLGIRELSCIQNIKIKTDLFIFEVLSPKHYEFDKKNIGNLWTEIAINSDVA